MDRAGQFQTQPKEIVTASSTVSFQVAKIKKPHNIAQTIIKPSLVVDICWEKVKNQR